jgi:amino acid transporter
MIPIAGSAYTYTYATLGELIAWVIGWDLILEYAFSNMSVSVGFAAHVVALVDWMGIPMSPKWLSPAYLPQGLQDLQGKDIYPIGWHSGFNIPAFLIVLLLTVVLVRGIRESARTNNIMVLVKIAALLAEWMAGRAGGWVDHLFHLYWVRFGFDGERGVQAAEARCADRDSGDAADLYVVVYRGGGSADGFGAVAVGGE